MTQQILSTNELNEQIQFEDECGVNTTLQEYFCGNVIIKND